MKKNMTAQAASTYCPQIWDATDLYAAMRAHGDKVALRYIEGTKVQEMTYKTFCDNIMDMAAGLDALGLSGKRIALIGENSPMWLTAYLAVLAMDSVIIPMDKEVAQAQIEQFIASVDAEAVIYGESFNGKFDGAMDSHPTLKHYIPMVPERGDHAKVTSYEKVLRMGAASVRGGWSFGRIADRSKMAEMLFTSGTTGSSKCVMLSQQNIYSTVNAAMQYICITPDDVSLSVLPVHHTYELMCLQAELLLGMTVCINDKLRHVVKNMNRFKPTVMTLVPLFLDTMEKKVWAEAEKKGKAQTLRKAIKASDTLRKMGMDARRKLFADVHKAFGGNLRVIICGGAKLNPALIKTFDSFGIAVYEGCGITECSPLTTLNPYFAPKPGSIGRPVSSCNLRLDTAGYGKNDKGYLEGEIQVKGANVMLGYYQNPEANAAVFTDDGWFRTGDVGYRDEKGYYYITGRCKSVIVLDNGKNVFPEEIEEYLSALDTVAECVVVGRKPDENTPTALVAVIYPNYDKFQKDSSDENVKATILASIRAINRDLPSFKQIQRIELRKTEFEKTTSKKIKRHLIK
ncbi:MAG: AMP-binding protein [Clostridia bacterium]|nr:AMP-binding protein [Clostridia bacterium]